MLQQCTEALVKHLDGGLARIWTLNDAERMLELQASAGTHTQLDGPQAKVPIGVLSVGMIALERTPQLSPAEQIDPHLDDALWARREGMVAFAGYPLLVDSKLVGVMTIFSRREFSSSVQDTMAAVADGVAVGIERKRAEAELNRRAKDLEEAHEIQRTNAQQLSALVDQLRVTQRHAEAATRAKSDFLASMSHELRTPLNAIILYSELLQEEAADHGQQGSITDLQKIQSAGKHLLELINDILDLSKIEAGKMSLSIETFDIRTMLDELLDTAAPLVQKNNNRAERPLRGHAGHDGLRPDEDAADPVEPAEQRRQVHPGRRDHARRPPQHHGRTAVRRVRGHGHRRRHDTGPDGEDLRAVHAGRRDHDSKVRRHRPGTRAGLALLSIDGWFGGGPERAGRRRPLRGPPAAYPDTRARSRPAHRRGSRNRWMHEARRPSWSSKTTKPAATRSRDVWQRRGYRIVLAVDGHEAVSKGRSASPDLILMDLGLPGIDGWEATRRLKGDPATAQIPSSSSAHTR